MDYIIKRDAAEYYCNCLLKNKQALEYLTKTVLRTPEIIERFRLGYSDGKLVDYLTKEKKHDLKDIIDAGLAKPDGTDLIPEDCYIYPYIVDDDVVCFGYKKKSPALTKKTSGSELSILYNQDAASVIHRGLYVFQDEDSLISTIQRAKNVVNCVAIGGVIKHEHIKVLAELQFEFLNVVFNNDTVGSSNLAKIVEGFRGTVTKLIQYKFGKNCTTFDEYTRISVIYSDIFTGVKQIPIEEPQTKGFIYEDGYSYVYFNKSSKNAEPEIITNFLIEIVNRVVKEDGTISREVRLKSADDTSDLFILNPSDMPTATSFCTFCLGQGNFVFKGKDNELKELWEYLFSKDNARKIYYVDQVGYVEKFDLWVFGNVAISKNKVIEIDENKVFWLDDKTGIKVEPISIRRLPPKINIADSDFDIKSYIDEVENALNNNIGAFKGCIVLGYIVSNIYSNEIFEKFGFFPIFFVYGKFESGKNILCDFIMKFFGLINSASAIHENTQTAMSRLLSYYSSIPVWVDEYKASVRKIKGMDGFFRDIYNKVPPAKSKKEDKGIRDVPVNGNLILSGEEMPTDPALRNRCFPLNLSSHERNDNFYDEVISLSKNFSLIVSKLILGKNEERINRLLSLIEKNKHMFISKGFNNRQAEVYSVIVSGYIFLKDSEALLPWVIEQMTSESDKRVEETTVVIFWEEVESLFHIETQKIKEYFARSESENKVWVWFAELYRMVSKNYRQRTNESFPSKGTVRDQLSEEPYFISKKFTKYIAENRRTCIVLDYEKCPDVIKTLCKDLPAESLK